MLGCSALIIRIIVHFRHGETPKVFFILYAFKRIKSREFPENLLQKTRYGIFYIVFNAVRANLLVKFDSFFAENRKPPSPKKGREHKNRSFF